MTSKRNIKAVSAKPETKPNTTTKKSASDPEKPARKRLSKADKEALAQEKEREEIVSRIIQEEPPTQTIPDNVIVVEEGTTITLAQDEPRQIVVPIKIKQLWSKAMVIPNIWKYVIVSVLSIAAAIWIQSLFNKRQITKNDKKVEKLHKVDDRLEDSHARQIDSLAAAFKEEVEQLKQSNEATRQRVEEEKRGAQIRYETKKQTDNVIKKIQNPSNTDLERERIAREILNRPNVEHKN